MQMAVFKYILSNRLRRIERYPLVLMLEPLFACNLACSGCGKIQYPAEVLRKRLSPRECLDAAEECGAPIVSIAGGEPLAHKDIQEIVEGLIAAGKYIYLCTNALLLEKSLHKFKPSSQLTLNIHLDGLEEDHDKAVSRTGVFKTAVQALKAAKAAGHYVNTNTTVFQGKDPERYRRFFDFVMSLGVDGMTISPGYAYEKAPDQKNFLTKDQTRAWFRETLKDWRKRGWVFNHSPFYMDFLEGKRDYDCTPWGNPLRNIFGWQRPCYLIAEGEPAASFKELLETTDWKKYGPCSGNAKCADCMAHVGFEPSSVVEAFSTPRNFMTMVLDFAAISKRPANGFKEAAEKTSKSAKVS